MVEGGGLLNRYMVNSRIEGSNPSPSANFNELGAFGPVKASTKFGTKGEVCKHSANQTLISGRR